LGWSMLFGLFRSCWVVIRVEALVQLDMIEVRALDRSHRQV
jgi:hypothetical protein